MKAQKGIIEFGEHIWAKAMRSKEWHKKRTMDARWTAGTWVGINPRTGEHLVVLRDGGALIKVRTMTRRPLAERWNAMVLADIGALLRRPEPNNEQGNRVRRIQPGDAEDEQDERGIGVRLEDAVVQKKEPQAQDFRIMPSMLEAHGKTEGCRGREASGSGTHLRHNPECRERFQEILRQDEVLKERIESRDKRESQEARLQQPLGGGDEAGVVPRDIEQETDPAAAASGLFFQASGQRGWKCAVRNEEILPNREEVL